MIFKFLFLFLHLKMPKFFKNDFIVVFDINGTLLYKSETKIKNATEYKLIETNKKFYYIRPGIDFLIEFLHKNNITYMFWTHNEENEAQHAYKILEGEGFKKDTKMFTRNECETAVIEGKKHNGVKNLDKVPELFDKKIFNLENIFIVDDTGKNIKEKHKKKLIPIQKFEINEKSKIVYTKKDFEDVVSKLENLIN